MTETKRSQTKACGNNGELGDFYYYDTNANEIRTKSKVCIIKNELAKTTCHFSKSKTEYYQVCRNSKHICSKEGQQYTCKGHDDVTIDKILELKRKMIKEEPKQIEQKKEEAKKEETKKEELFYIEDLSKDEREQNHEKLKNLQYKCKNKNALPTTMKVVSINENRKDGSGYDIYYWYGICALPTDGFGKNGKCLVENQYYQVSEKYYCLMERKYQIIDEENIEIQFNKKIKDFNVKHQYS